LRTPCTGPPSPHGTLRAFFERRSRPVNLNPILQQIASELRVRTTQVQSAVDLLDGGASVPFIARYRKEATEGLDDVQLRELEVRLIYLRELEQRRATVLASIDEQGQLTPALHAAIEAAPTKQDLEDLYLPFKPKRRSKGLIAREAGLEPLAERLFSDPALEPLSEAAAFVNAEAGFVDAPAVLDGVRDLLAERWAEDAVLVGKLREWLWSEWRLRAKLLPGKDEQSAEAAKFRDYFDYDEAIASVPSHRALAVFRARSLDVVEARLAMADEPAPARRFIEAGVPVALGTDFNPGTSPNPNLPLVMTVACLEMKLSPEEALAAVTVNAAHAAGLGDEAGALEPGKLGDAVVWRAASVGELPYWVGADLVNVVVKRGRIVYRRAD